MRTNPHENFHSDVKAKKYCGQHLGVSFHFFMENQFLTDFFWEGVGWTDIYRS